MLRDTAARFDVEQRRESVSFEAHRDAGSPEKLDEIVEAVKTREDIKRPTCAVIRHINSNKDISVLEAVKTYTRDPSIHRSEEAKIIREEAIQIAEELSPTPRVHFIGGGGGGSGGSSGSNKVQALELMNWLDEIEQRLEKIDDALAGQRWSNDTLDMVKEKTLSIINQARTLSDKCGKDDPKTRFNIVAEKH